MDRRMKYKMRVIFNQLKSLNQTPKKKAHKTPFKYNTKVIINLQTIMEIMMIKSDRYSLVIIINK